MKKNEVKIGGVYVVKVNDKLAKVRINREAPYGGWLGTNLATKRQVHIKSPARLRGLASKPDAKAKPKASTKPKAAGAASDQASTSPTPEGTTAKQAGPSVHLDAIVLALAEAPAKPALSAQLLPADLAHAAALPRETVEAIAKQDDDLLSVGSEGHIYLTAAGQKRAKVLLRAARRTARLEKSHRAIREAGQDGPTSPQSPRVASGKAKAKPTTKAKPGGTRAKGAAKSAKKPARQKRGCLAAAVEVLQGAKEPMTAKAIVTAALERGLWATKGKTPEATLYAAMIREIAAKGNDSRFRKVDRGKFTAAK